MPLRRLASAALLAPFLSLQACAGGGEIPDYGDLPLAGGHTVRDLVSDEDRAVLLLYHPSQTFSCFTVLSRWLEIRRGDPDRVRLVFTHPPGPHEQRLLRILRIEPDGLLATHAEPVVRTPAELLFERGEPVSLQENVSSLAGSDLAARFSSSGSPLSGALSIDPNGNSNQGRVR